MKTLSFNSGKSLYCYFEEGEKAYREVLSPGQLMRKLDNNDDITRCDICGIDGRDYTIDNIWFDEGKKRYFVSIKYEYPIPT